MVLLPAPSEYPAEERAKAKVTAETAGLLREVRDALAEVSPWDQPSLEAALRGFADSRGLKFGEIVHPMRLAVTGSTASPGIFEVLDLIGIEETLRRISALAEALH